MKKIKNIIKLLNRFYKPQKIEWLNSFKPYSRVFGLDRGTAIDRFFIDDFLLKNKYLINGTLLEFGDDRYINKFGGFIKNSIIFNANISNKNECYNIDITKISELINFKEHFDCIIATNVLNFIYDFETAVKNLSFIINKNNGHCLVTVSGISSISRFDYERWGDYFRFNDLSMFKCFSKYFKNVEIDFYGNSPLAAAFILGLSKEEVPENLFEHKDKDFQITITIKASNPVFNFPD